MTKPDKIDLILQLILDICIFVTIKTLSYDLRKMFGVVLDTFFLASWSNFWGKNKALVRLYLHSWTWFDVPIIFSVKFWWFFFFWILYCSSRTQVISVGSSVNICRNFSHIRADDDYGDLWFVMMMMINIIIIITIMLIIMAVVMMWWWWWWWELALL